MLAMADRLSVERRAISVSSLRSWSVNTNIPIPRHPQILQQETPLEVLIRMQNRIEL